MEKKKVVKLSFYYIKFFNWQKLKFCFKMLITSIIKYIYIYLIRSNNYFNFRINISNSRANVIQ